jgi:hypothetical protein
MAGLKVTSSEERGKKTGLEKLTTSSTDIAGPKARK